MKCPNCGSENCHFVSTTETHSTGYSAGKACCGALLMGPAGMICGLCGTSVKSHTREYWICNSCGDKFSQSEAEEVMRNEAQGLKEFLFYCEVQKRSVVEPFETRMGERVLQGIENYLKEIFPKEAILLANPLVENQKVESLKYGIGQVLTEKELVYLVLPSIRLVIAEKGLIFNNTVYVEPLPFRFYKNYVYFGQNFITTMSRNHAEKLCEFLEYIYLGDNTVLTEDGYKTPHECENYFALLTELQNLKEDDPNKPEHFSSQAEYAQFVKELREKMFQKFLESNSDACMKYEKIIEEGNEKETRWMSYTFWSLGTAIIMLIIQWIRQGFFAGVVSAFIVTGPFWAIIIGLFFYKEVEIDKVLPDWLKEIIEEDERENIEKTGKIRFQDYSNIL